MALLTGLVVEQLPALVSGLSFGWAQTLRAPHSSHPTLESPVLLLKARHRSRALGVAGRGCGGEWSGSTSSLWFERSLPRPSPLLSSPIRSLKGVG